MFIALSRNHGINTLEIDDVELVGEYEIMHDTPHYFMVFFEDDRQFHIDFLDQMVTVMQDGNELLNEYTGSLEFLNTIAEALREGFPQYEAYTDTEFNDFIPDTNSQATQSVRTRYNSNNYNSNSRFSVGSLRSRKTRRTKRTRRTRRLRRTRR